MLSPVPYLQFESVTKTFATLQVVESPFNLIVPRQQFVAFLGPSGCGKTTLMRMVGGLDSPSTGSIQLEGAPVGGPDRRRGMVFQSYSSFPWLTVEQNIMFGMKYRHDMLAPQKRERALHYLRLVGLQDFGASYPNRISGGMRQRVAIARTLAAGSEILLMDEPFGALDAQLREELQVEMRRIQIDDAKTIIFVTHDVEEAVFLADRVIVFSPRPATIRADIDITAILGKSRDLAMRDSAEFFRIRTEILHMLRGAHKVAS